MRDPEASSAGEALPWRMRHAEELSRRRLGLALVAGAIAIGAWWAAMLSEVGIRTSWDSAMYLMFSLEMAENRQLFEQPQWPPLYPALVAALLPFTRFPAEAAALASGAVVAGVLAAVGLGTLRLSRDGILAALALLFVGVWPAFLHVYSVAWSEQPYALFTLVHVLLVARHWRTGQLSDYALAAAFIPLASLSRYLGYSLIPAFGLYSLWHLHRRAGWRALPQHAIAGGLALAPIALWLARNHRIDGTLHGDREPTDLTFADNLALTADVIGETWAATPFLSALSLASAFALALLLRYRRTEASLAALYGLGYLAGYLGMLLYTTSTVALDGINLRYFSPLLPVAFVVALAPLAELPRWAYDAASPGLAAGLRWGLRAAVAAGLIGNFLAWRADTAALRAPAGKAAEHTVAGFNLTQTAEAIGETLGRELARRERLAVTVLSQLNASHKGRVMFLRGGALRASGLRFTGYSDVDLRTFTLNFEAPDGPRELVYYTMPAVRDLDKLEKSLAQMLTDAEADRGLLLTTAKTLQKLDQETPPETLASKALSCRKGREIKPFVVYACEEAVK